MRISGEDLREAVADVAQVRAVGKAVQQRQAVGKDAGRKRAQQKIFQSGFVGAAVAAQKSDEHIGGNRHQLQADEDEHDVETGGHAHHADDREQHQSVIFAVIFMLGLHVAHRHENGNAGGRKEQIEEEESAAVDQHGAHHAERTQGDGAVGLHPKLNLTHAAGGKQHADEGSGGVDPLVSGGSMRSMSRMPRANRVSRVMGRASR